jgi:hypothetical protein
MTSLRPRDKVALSAVAAVLVLVGFYFLVISPQLSKVSDLNKEIASQKATLNQDELTYQEGRAAQIGIHTNGAEWAAVRRAVPATANVPGLLRLLQNNSNLARVKLSSVTMTGNGGATSGASAGTSTDPSAASAVPQSLVFSGSYQNIEKLARHLDHLVVVDQANKLRSFGPLVTIGSVSLSNATAGVNASLTATIYEQPQAQATGTSTTVETTAP